MIHNAPMISKDLVDDLKTKNDNGSNYVNEDIQLVKEINPRVNIVRSFVGTATSTLMTTDATRDFFLVSCSLSSANTGLTATTSNAIQCNIEGTSRHLCGVALPANTAVGSSNNCFFGPKGIKLDRGTALNINQDVNGATVIATIAGYYVE